MGWKSDKAFFVDEDREWLDWGNQDIETQVPLETHDEQWVCNVPLDYTALLECVAP